MDFGTNKTPDVQVINKGAFGGTYLETLILVLMESGTKSHGKKSISWKILTRNFIVQINMIGVSINMVLNPKHH